ncbi:MAG: N-6 DNA methylase, partial [Myroides sp.]
VVSMPSNIFATTGTNVSILFLDGTNKDNVILIDASDLGEKIKDGKNQKTILNGEEEELIIDNFNNKSVKDSFSICLSYEQLEQKKYSFSAGQYFEVKIDRTDIGIDEFTNKINEIQNDLSILFTESSNLQSKISQQLNGLNYES